MRIQPIKGIGAAAMLLIGSPTMADILAAWDVNGVDVEAGATSFPYTMNATTNGINISGGELSLGFDVPSEAANMYGFKFSAATHQTSLADAVANNHYIQFTVTAETGYRFDLTSIEMNGQSGTSGPDDIALMSGVAGFTAGNEITSLTGRQGITGGWDTDTSGWGEAISLIDMQYQNLTSATFRIYGWNSTGTASSGIRNLSGNDLIINGTVETVPEPAVIGFISLGGIALIAAKRVFR
ncbi:MAG: hypothetical protein V3V05_01725 [Pontiella sp.]